MSPSPTSISMASVSYPIITTTPSRQPCSLCSIAPSAGVLSRIPGWPVMAAETMAECDRCDVYFSFDPEEIYVLESDDAPGRRDRIGETGSIDTDRSKSQVTEKTDSVCRLVNNRDFGLSLSSGFAFCQGTTNLITITRCKARLLRAVFRRAILGIRHRSSIPPLVLHTEGTHLRAQYLYDSLAVEYVEPGQLSRHSTRFPSHWTFSAKSKAVTKARSSSRPRSLTELSSAGRTAAYPRSAIVR